MNSVNALLKIVEEPNENVLFILVFDCNKKISTTLKSRCIKYNINLSFQQSITLTNEIINDDINNFLNSELVNFYSSPGDLINLLNLL